MFCFWNLQKYPKNQQTFPATPFKAMTQKRIPQRNHLFGRVYKNKFWAKYFSWLFRFAPKSKMIPASKKHPKYQQTFLATPLKAMMQKLIPQRTHLFGRVYKNKFWAKYFSWLFRFAPKSKMIPASKKHPKYQQTFLATPFKAMMQKRIPQRTHLFGRV